MSSVQSTAESLPLRARGGEDEIGFVLTGGGARAAYQVGVLRYIARVYPELRVPVITGVSAGGVNAAHLASHHGTFQQSVEELAHLWQELTVERVYRVDPWSLGWIGMRWLARLVIGGFVRTPEVRALLDTEPLRRFLTEALAAVDGELTGIDYNLARGSLRAVAISTTSYTTGQSVVWVEGKDIEAWTRPKRRSEQTRLTIDHVMASAALPLFFPAVPIGPAWYGDGGLRLTAPLSPALHLGASRLITISTRFDRSQEEADQPSVIGYPPPAQVLGMMLNAIFLDLVDQDVVRLERLNRLIERLPRDQRNGLRIIKMAVIRPSQDLAALAGTFEPRMPFLLRALTRSTGSRQTRSPDVLSMLMFQRDYLKALLELGERDAEAQGETLRELIEGESAELAVG